MSKILIDEATVKLALEAMERISTADDDCDFLNVRQAVQLEEAITAVKQALEQPVTEEWKLVPVEPTREMWTAVNKLDDLMTEYCMERTSFAKRVDEIFKQALTAPAQEIVCSTGLCHYKAQRPWVGLTDDEFRYFASTFDYGTGGLIRAIEAKLKEKNT